MAYDEEIAAALEAIKEAGTLLTFTKNVPGTVNAVTDRETGASQLQTTAYVVILPPPAPKPGESYAKDSQVLASMRRLLIAASGMAFAPEEGQEVGTIEGKTWRVGPVTSLAPDGGAAIIYKALVMAGAGNVAP